MDPAANDNYAIRFATAFGHLEVVKYLCSLPGVNPAADDNCAIRYAAKKGHLEVVNFLTHFQFLKQWRLAMADTFQAINYLPGKSDKFLEGKARFERVF